MLFTHAKVHGGFAYLTRDLCLCKLNMQKHQCYVLYLKMLLPNLPFNSGVVRRWCFNAQKEKDYTEIVNNAIFSYLWRPLLAGESRWASNCLRKCLSTLPSQRGVWNFFLWIFSQPAAWTDASCKLSHTSCSNRKNTCSLKQKKKKKLVFTHQGNSHSLPNLPLHKLHSHVWGHLFLFWISIGAAVVPEHTIFS